MQKCFIIFLSLTIFTSLISAEPLGICTTKNKRPITLTYKNKQSILVIDGKYTAKLYDSDSFNMNGKFISFNAYLNKKYGFWVENINGEDSLSVVPAKYIHGIAVDQDRTEVKYSCKWYK